MRTGRPPKITAELIREWERVHGKFVPVPAIATALYGNDNSKNVANVLKIMARADIQGDGERFAYRYQGRGTQLTQRFGIEDLKKKWG